MNNLEELCAGLYPPAVPPAALGKVGGEANATEMYLSSGAKEAATPPSLKQRKQTSDLTPSLAFFSFLFIFFFFFPPLQLQGM